MLFLLRNGQESVAWVFLDDTIFWKIYWLTLFVLLYLCEEVDGLWFTTAQRDFGLVKIVCDALAVSVTVSHWLLYLLLVLTRVSVPPGVTPCQHFRRFGNAYAGVGGVVGARSNG